MTEVPNVTLNNGVQIPQLGFGVFKVPPDETVDVVAEALWTGYRHIDTAQMYGNERQVGRAIRESGIPAGDVFVTSKLNNDMIGYDAALRGLERTIDDLAVDHLDLFLIHWPLPNTRDYVETWRALERGYADGLVRAIGVSNFQIEHLRKVLAGSDVVPAVNQIELHPYLSQEPLRTFDSEHEIATEAWAPIARGKVLDDPVIVSLAERHGKTPAQVVLRWQIQLGTIVFPKSVTPSRIRENFDIFDFELQVADMAEINGLNQDRRTGPDPDTM